MLVTNTICAVLTLILSLWVISAVALLSKGNVSGMARIYLSEILQNIRGSVGNHVYSCWKGLNYLRNKAVSIMNPRSEDQQNMRYRTTLASRTWHSILNDDQRALWNEYAQQRGSASKQTGPNSNGGAGTKSLIPGNGGVMSGFNAYVMNNGIAYSGGNVALGVLVSDAPLGIDAPDAPTALTCEWNAVTCQIDLTWVDPLDPGVFRIRIWVVSLDGGVHKQLVANVAKAGLAYSIDAIAIALGQITNVRSVPGHYHIQIDATSAEGAPSPASAICQVTVPAACVPV